MARIALDARKLRDFGIGTYIEALIRGLRESVGDEEFLLFLAPGATTALAPRVTAVHVAAKNYGLVEHFALPFHCRRQRIDLFHTPHYVLPWFQKSPTVVTIHDLIHLRFPEYLPSRAALLYAQQIMARSFRRATRVLTVSESSKVDLLERFGGPEHRITVIHNTVAEEFFTAPSDETLDAVRERWDLSAPFLLYTGNIKPHKNLDRLLEAFAIVSAREPGKDLRLVFLGNHTSAYQALRRRAGELGLLPRIRLLGWLPRAELRSVYQLAKVFVYPSLHEGFGLPPLEAMASGVPVVASNTSSLPEVCGDAALLIDPTDVEAIAHAIERVLGDPALTTDLIRKGYARAAGFRGAAQAQRTLTVYREVLNGTR